ncbi:unnamed protein product [Candida verbasci]|uniref:Uncharacterized protein n=1 Tax=Candida verbasci TaxID=1227364 RepID=A0A9W4TSM7_9ASCO|nr:unnamed protein product [Candida verbasci]
MFKSSISSYLIPQWFNRNKPITKQQTDSSSIPKNIIIKNDDNKLINISMNNNKVSLDEGEDDFIDIQTKQLTYAEVASLGKNKSQTNNKVKKTSIPSKGIVESNQFDVLGDDLEKSQDAIEASTQPTTYDLFKTDDEYQKSKNYKSKQFETIQKKKAKNQNLKAKAKKV